MLWVLVGRGSQRTEGKSANSHRVTRKSRSFIITACVSYGPSGGFGLRLITDLITEEKKKTWETKLVESNQQ